jgi:hypothetical protein
MENVEDFFPPPTYAKISGLWIFFKDAQSWKIYMIKYFALYDVLHHLIDT